MPDLTKHTPGLVEAVPEELCEKTKHVAGRRPHIKSVESGEIICDLLRSKLHPNRDTIAEANARRLAAAWNACEGISTEALERGVVKELIELCQRIADDFRQTSRTSLNTRNALDAAIDKLHR